MLGSCISIVHLDARRWLQLVKAMIKTLLEWIMPLNIELLIIIDQVLLIEAKYYNH